MTMAQAKAILRAVGLSIRLRDGEYRVNYANGSEATAYYTNDRDDAVNTGLAMKAYA